MEDLKDKIEDFFSSISISSVFLLKVIAGIFLINIALFFYNIGFNQIIYEKVKSKINDNKILIVDNNGNQYFKRIGYLNEETVLEFAVMSIRNLLESSYNSDFSKLYAKKYASERVYKQLLNRKEEQLTQFTLDEGYYLITYENVKFNKIDEKHGEWEIEAKIKKQYNGLGVDNNKKDEIIKVTVIYKPNLIKNQLGLLIATLNEKELSKEEMEDYQDMVEDWEDERKKQREKLEEENK